jgi:hypothetical protein
MAAPFVEVPGRVLLKGTSDSQTSQHKSNFKHWWRSASPDAASRIPGGDVESLTAAAAAASGRDLSPVQSWDLLQLRNRHRNSIQARAERKPGGSIEYFAERQDQTGREYCLFLSWDCGGETRIVDIPIADPEDEVQIYKDMKEQYYRVTGRWRRFGIFDVQSIRPTKVRELASACQ